MIKINLTIDSNHLGNYWKIEYETPYISEKYLI